MKILVSTCILTMILTFNHAQAEGVDIDEYCSVKGNTVAGMAMTLRGGITKEHYLKMMKDGGANVTMTKQLLDQALRPEFRLASEKQIRTRVWSECKMSY